MSDPGDLFEVSLLEMPLVLRERSQQHGADLLREMALLSAGHSAGTAQHPAPQRLLDLVATLTAVYEPFVATTNEQMEAALDRGEESLPLVRYVLPRSSLPFLEHLTGVLAEVEEYCRTGDHLLVLTPDPDVAAYREWSIGEVRRQAEGLPPVPWPLFASSRGLSLQQ